MGDFIGESVERLEDKREKVLYLCDGLLFFALGGTFGRRFSRFGFSLDCYLLGSDIGGERAVVGRRSCFALSPTWTFQFV